MGRVTGIEWCDHTYNSWIGLHQGAACDHQNCPIRPAFALRSALVVCDRLPALRVPPITTGAGSSGRLPDSGSAD